MPGRSNFSALLFASVIALTLAIIAFAGKILFPSICREGAGIGASAGGVSELFFSGLLVMVAIVFVIVFFILRKPHLK